MSKKWIMLLVVLFITSACTINKKEVSNDINHQATSDSKQKLNQQNDGREAIIVTFRSENSDLELKFNLEEPLSLDEINNLDAESLGYLRNAYYAKHGYIFTTDIYLKYFEAMNWYIPLSNDVEEQFSQQDRENIATIIELEKQREDILKKDSDINTIGNTSKFDEINSKEDYTAVAWLSDTEIIVNKMIKQDAIPYMSSTFEQFGIFIYDITDDSERPLNIINSRGYAEALSTDKRYLVYKSFGGMHSSLGVYNFETEEGIIFSKGDHAIYYGFDEKNENILYHFEDEEDIYSYNIASKRTGGEKDKILKKLHILDNEFILNLEEQVTRQDMEVVILKLFKAISPYNAGDILPSLGKAQSELANVFIDSMYISEQAAPYIAYGVKNGYIGIPVRQQSLPYEPFFEPNRGVTGLEYMNKILLKLGYTDYDPESIIYFFSIATSLDGIDQSKLNQPMTKSTFIDITYNALMAKNIVGQNVAGILVNKGNFNREIFETYDIPIIYGAQTKK